MIDRRGDFKRLTLIAVVLALSGSARISRGQEVDARDAPGPDAQQGAWTDQQFDASIDEIVKDVNDRDTLENGRLDERLSIKLDWIQVSSGISEAQ
jgi:hypothetical protein